MSNLLNKLLKLSKSNVYLQLIFTVESTKLRSDKKIKAPWKIRKLQGYVKTLRYKISFKISYKQEISLTRKLGTAGGSFSGDDRTWQWSMSIAEYHQELFYHYFFFWPVVFDFTPKSLSCLVSGSGSLKQCQVWVLLHWVGLKWNLVLIGYSQKLCVTIGIACLTGMAPL